MAPGRLVAWRGLAAAGDGAWVDGAASAWGWCAGRWGAGGMVERFGAAGRRPACQRRMISSSRPKMRARAAMIMASSAAVSQQRAVCASAAARRLANWVARGMG